MFVFLDVDSVLNAPNRDIAIRNFLNEHKSISDYVIFDDDISECSMKDVTNFGMRKYIFFRFYNENNRLNL